MQLKMKYWPLVAAMAWVVPASATDLGTISVTDQRSAAPIGQAAHAVSIIDRKTIEASHVQNVVDLFKSIPDVVVRDTSGVGAKAQVDLGGYGETAPANSVVLVDGRRVNAPDISGVDWTQIPVDQIERIEIVHGGGSVLYGQGAVGGVINIITRVPESGGKVSAEGGSFGTAAGQLRAGVATGALRVEANASGLRTDGYRKNGQFKRFDGGLRGEVDLPAGHMLYFSGNHHTDRAGLPGALTLAQMAVDPRQTNKPVDYSRTIDDFASVGLQAGVGAVHADVPLSYRRRDTNAVYNSIFGTTRISEVLRSVSARPKIDLDQDFAQVSARLVAGADLDRTDGTLGGVKAKRNSAGYYGFVRLSDSSGIFGLNGGYRFETMADDFRIGAGQSASNRKGVYQVGLTVAKAGFHLALNQSTSVRMPLVDEQVIYPFPTFIQTYQAVKMQTGKHFGVTARYGNEQGYAEFSFRRADLTNEIFFNPATFTNQNYTGETRHDVWMVQEEWQLTDVARLAASYTYTVARFRGGAFDGKDIPAVPKHKVGARLTTDFHNGFGMMLNLGWVSSSWSISDQANALPKLPSYLVMDASLNYRWKKAELFASLQNLTNRKYSTYSTYGVNYYPAATLTARAGVSYSF